MSAAEQVYLASLEMANALVTMQLGKKGYDSSKSLLVDSCPHTNDQQFLLWLLGCHVVHSKDSPLPMLGTGVLHFHRSCTKAEPKGSPFLAEARRLPRCFQSATPIFAMEPATLHILKTFSAL